MTTPAERASAVAFAWKNCALESLIPNKETYSAAQSYERGLLSADELMAETEQRQHADKIVTRTVKMIEHGWVASGDLQELRTIHHWLFDGVHNDAGKLRSTDTTKDSSGARSANPEAFFPSNLIDTGAANISRELAEKRNLKCLDRGDFVRELAHIYDELGYLHPFVGGNAMVLRIFASRLSHDAGWDLDWGIVDANTYKQAKRAAYNGDTSDFVKLFSEIIRPANPTRTFLIAGWNQGPAH
ncbi:Fic family protein [Bifidobacterium sp.]|uniref:Fic family protein n=1 Tax=Bifidobacterium sp. TaxID=41200 RepID=UPI0025B7EF4C|nr:Fic family protein [Bifidobacterium sp.]MCH4160512.1 Fic family protein [Bifidobacterium sp.]MCH4174618.1 Fic family protein [Bifidobacterium sp.]MCI1636029.1 Fic family protein [Bifidobacterium sp.]